MSFTSFGFDNEYSATILSASALLVLAVHLVPYVVDTRGIRSIPGPWLAKFTDAWLGRVAARGHRSEVVHELHKQYGKSTPLPTSNPPSPRLGTDGAPSQEPSYDSPQTTCQLPIQTPSKSSTPTETEARRATFTMRLCPSTEASSTPAIGPITRESARSSLIYFPSRMCWSSSLMSVCILESCSGSGTNSLKAERRVFRVRRVMDGLGGTGGFGLTAFRVSWPYPT